jgi:hypothetical protein
VPIAESGPWWLSTTIVTIVGLLQYCLRRQGPAVRHQAVRSPSSEQAGPDGRVVPSRQRGLPLRPFDEERITKQLYDTMLFDESLFSAADDPAPDHTEDPHKRRGA